MTSLFVFVSGFSDMQAFLLFSDDNLETVRFLLV